MRAVVPTGLLGRDHELNRIAAVLARSREPRRATVIRVAGEPGVGRSALLDAVVCNARAAGWVALDSRCYAGERRTPVAALRRLAEGFGDVADAGELLLCDCDDLHIGAACAE